MFFKVISKIPLDIIHHQKGVLKGSLDFMQHFKFVNWRIRFLMSRTTSPFFLSVITLWFILKLGQGIKAGKESSLGHFHSPNHSSRPNDT
jgi:hypothetical protein